MHFHVQGEDEHDFNGGYTLDDQACPYMPGTPEKVEMLMDRCRRRVSLWHPLDAR